jgi:hypothetical protein
MRKLYILKTLSLLLILSGHLQVDLSYAAPGTLSTRVMLITQEEASRADAQFGSGKFASKEPSDGPTIEFLKPTPDTEIVKPVPIEINFKENQAPIDLATLEVTYLKFLSIDITERVLPYATMNGIKIANADLPTGTHRVKFSIKDTENQLTEKTLKIKIVDSD